VTSTRRHDDVGVSLRDVVTSYNVTVRGASLSIHGVKRSDQINYFCTLANDLGNTNVTVFVRVKGRSVTTLLETSKKTCTLADMPIAEPLRLFGFQRGGRPPS